MTELRARALKSLTATALLAATLYACSSTTGGFGNDSNGNGSSSGSTGDDAAGGNAGDDASPGMGTGPAGGDSGAGGADGAMTEPADATVGPHADASSPRDSGASPLDSSPGTSTDASSDESAWLDPQNAARMDTMANEPALTWNPILAEVALAYAKQCVWAHNPNLQANYKSAGGTTSAGENIAAGAPTLTIASANSGWIDEKSIYDYATNTCNTAGMKECGHYTQIVWKTTTSVGCAIVNCTTNSPFSGGGKWTFAVCDYAPAGNLVPQGSTTPERPY